MRSSTWSSSRPGGTRQSTISSARAGMTLILSEALIRVGVTVTPSMACTSRAMAGSCSLTSSTAPAASPSMSTPRAPSSARGSSVKSYGRLRAQALEHRRHLQQRVVAQHGTDAWPAAPRSTTRKRNTPFSAQHTA